MGREIQRSYLPTPELLKDGVRISTVPINLAAGDWNGLNRLLETVRKAIVEPQGTITGRLFRTAVEPDKRVEIDTAHGIRIYDSNNDLVAQLDGDELTIAGGTITGGTITGSTITGGTVTGTTIIGSTFKTAVSPNARVEIDTVNGIRIYNSANTLVGQWQYSGASYLSTAAATITSLFSTDILGGTLHSSIHVPSSGTAEILSISSGTGGLGGLATIIVDGQGVSGLTSIMANGSTRLSVSTTAISALNGAAFVGNVTGNVTGDLTGNITGNLNATGSNGPIITGSSQVQLGINKADGGTDQKRFEALWYTGGTFALRFVNDAYTLADEILNVTQTAGSYLIDHITIPQNLTVTGTLSAGSTAFGISIQYLDWASNPQTLSL